jgi:polar amino acid transport system substrate-binding protein
MKKTIIFVLISFLGCTKKEVENKVKPLIVAMELQFPPFETSDTNGDPIGISVEIAKELAAYLERPLEIKNTSWTGLIPSLQTGKADIVISSMTITEERAKVVNFSDPYATSGLTLLINKNSKVSSFDDLDQEGATIAVKSGTVGAILAQETLKKANIRLLDEVSTCVIEVSQGKADAFIYDALTVFENYKKHKETTRINLKSISGTDHPWGFALKQDNTELLVKVNEFIKKSQDTGAFNKIGEKYLGEVMMIFKENNIPSFFDVK